MLRISLDTLNELLTTRGARWRARDNPVLHLSPEALGRILGADDPEEAPPPSTLQAVPSSVGDGVERVVDWRDRHGESWVSPIRNQGSVGACVSFASIAAMESMLRVERRYEADLSEADSHFCSSHGEENSGWHVPDALFSLLTRGVVDEAVCLYGDATKDVDSPVCIAVPGRERRMFRLGVVEKFTWDYQAVWAWLRDVGPVIATMAVFEDFHAYKTVTETDGDLIAVQTFHEVYTHEWGESKGGHAILVIGYDLDDGCWICKNSWGTGWGADGYFKIAFGQCGMLITRPMYGIRSMVLPSTAAIQDRWVELGREGGVLGKEIGEETTTPGKDGRFRHYERGSIYWTLDSGAWSVHGAIRDRWEELGWETSPLGYPTSDERSARDQKGRYNTFQGGAIYWRAGVGAHSMSGALYARWLSLLGEIGLLGYPTSEPLVPPDQKGRLQHFQGGSLYWTKETGAWFVRGAIRDRWEQLGWETGPLGYPTSDEVEVGSWRRNTFEKGEIWWSAAVGAHAVYGPVYDKWKAMQASLIRPGAPLTDIQTSRASGGVFCTFERGTIYWTAARGAWYVAAAR